MTWVRVAGELRKRLGFLALGCTESGDLWSVWKCSQRPNKVVEKVERLTGWHADPDEAWLELGRKEGI